MIHRLLQLMLSVGGPAELCTARQQSIMDDKWRYATVGCGDRSDREYTEKTTDIFALLPARSTS